MFFFALSLMRFMAYVTCFLLIIESYVKLKAVSLESQHPEFKSQLGHFLAKYPPTNYSDFFQLLRSFMKEKKKKLLRGSP